MDGHDPITGEITPEEPDIPHNMRHWLVLGRTDPAHTKQFQRGGFRGTATRPIWNEMRLTEHFGPCGLGWGFRKPGFTLTPTVDGQHLVICLLECWYADGDGNPASLWGIGGDTILKMNRDGKVSSDDESYKKAFTDALGNAFKHIGVNADIHMGMFDDSKYVNETRAHFAEAASEPAEARTTAKAAPRTPMPRSAVEAPPGASSAPAVDLKVAARTKYVEAQAAIDGCETANALDAFLSSEDFDVVRDAIEKVEGEAAPGIIKRLTDRAERVRERLDGAPNDPIPF